MVLSVSSPSDILNRRRTLLRRTQGPVSTALPDVVEELRQTAFVNDRRGLFQRVLAAYPYVELAVNGPSFELKGSEGRTLTFNGINFQNNGTDVDSSLEIAALNVELDLPVVLNTALDERQLRSEVMAYLIVAERNDKPVHFTNLDPQQLGDILERLRTDRTLAGEFAGAMNDPRDRGYTAESVMAIVETAYDQLVAQGPSYAQPAELTAPLQALEGSEPEGSDGPPPVDLEEGTGYWRTTPEDMDADGDGRTSIDEAAKCLENFLARPENDLGDPKQVAKILNTFLKVCQGEKFGLSDLVARSAVERVLNDPQGDFADLKNKVRFDSREGWTPAQPQAPADRQSPAAGRPLPGDDGYIPGGTLVRSRGDDDAREAMKRRLRQDREKTRGRRRR